MSLGLQSGAEEGDDKVVDVSRAVVSGGLWVELGVRRGHSMGSIGKTREV